MGRPKKENSKIIASFRIDPLVYEQLKEKAKIEDITVSRYIEGTLEESLNSKRILNVYIPPSEEEDNGIRIQELGDDPRPRIFKTNNPNIYKSEKGSGNAELMARKLGITQQQVREWAE